VEQDDLYAIVEERARERNVAGVVRLERDFGVSDRRQAVGGQVVDIRGLHANYDDVFVSLFGTHQATNAALAVAACEAFGGGPIGEQELATGLGSVRVPGRIEVVGHRPLVVCDGAHNIAASDAVREAIVESFTFDRLIMVAGMVDTKLVEEVLGAWAPIVDRAFVTAPSTDRAAPAERLAKALESSGVIAERIATVANVHRAVDAALDEAGPDDLVLIFGSFYTVGEARAWLRSRGLLTEA
jgi:dihydrofolate synthase/folylpolyglutamate synthase